jgi:thiamine pyrophosphokinase
VSGVRPAAGVAVVFLDGEYGDAEYYAARVAAADIVLAADGGARFLLDLGVLPHAVVGDFDSLGAEDVERLAAAGVELQRHPVRKDATDGELAVDEALRRGASELVLAGGTGALDHTLGHLAILRHLAGRGIPASLVAPQLSARVLCAPATATLSSGDGTRVSVVPLGGDAVVTLAGLEYPLDRGLLPAVSCLGLGNHVTGLGQARIAVHDGAVAVLVESGEESFTAGGAARAGP